MFRTRHPSETLYIGRISQAVASSSLLIDKLDGPDLGAVQNTQNTNPIRRHDVGCNIARARHNKLACSGNPTRTTAFGKVEKAACSADDPSSTRTAVLGFSLSM